jgi:hypothetical protein
LPIPRFLAPEIAFDANLRFFMYVAVDSKKSPVEKSVTMNEILWERADDEGGRSVRSLERVVLTGGDAAERLARVAVAPVDGKPDVGLVQAMRTTAGRAFLVDGQGWRIVDQVAQRIAADAKDLRTLAPAPTGSECAALEALLSPRAQPGFKRAMLEDPEDDRYCFSIARGVPPDASPKTDQIVVAVYGRPSARALSSTGAPAPIASLPRFSRVRPDDEVVWKVGTAGRFAGWLVAWSPTSSGRLRHVAAPWSTCALWHLGSEILKEQPPEDLRLAKDEMNRKVCGAK